MGPAALIASRKSGKKPSAAALCRLSLSGFAGFASMPPPLRIGIAGLGTVGAAVITLLGRQAEALARRTGRKIVITGVSACHKAKQRGIDLARFAWFDDCVALARSPGIDLFVELIGGEEGAALAAAEAALDAGKSFVTANKALLAKHGMRLAALAEENGAALAFEASVAGGIPIVKTLREGLAGNSIERVHGILNGTCNYILTRMESEGLTFAQCLREAQKLGYAEANPAFDIGGFDTAHKLAILTSLAFGTVIDTKAIAIEGIELITLADLEAAAELGYRVKLLGVAQRTPFGIEQRVHPTMVPKSTAIAQVMGVTNAVTIDADAVHELTLVGPAPAARRRLRRSSPISPISHAACAPRRSAGRLPRSHLRRTRRCRCTKAAIISGFRCSTGRARRRQSRRAWPSAGFRWKASCSATVPAPKLGRGRGAVVLITHATHEKSVRQALEAAVADGFLAEKPQVIRIERE